MDLSEKIGFYSIGVNLILVGIKIGLSFMSGSVALFADAIHSATDVISSATVTAGIKISNVDHILIRYEKPGQICC